MSGLVSKNWDKDLALHTWEEIRSKALFAVIWSERKQGGYNNYDFEPFVALKKVINQGVHAYEGIRLGTSIDDLGGGKRVRRVNVSGRSYTPISFLEDAERMTVVKDPNDILQEYLNRWEKKD
jgi:hypothetical protein